jgi:hypothetical protein
MGFILEPNKPGEDLIINGWNWRPTVALLVREGVIPAGERAERCLANGCGGGLTADEAAAAADMLSKLIATLTPRQRIRHDGSIGWTLDHQRLRWEPHDNDLWIPLVELAERGTIDEMSRMLDGAQIPYAVRHNQQGGFRILVTLPNMDAASAAIADHPGLAHVRHQAAP